MSYEESCSWPYVGLEPTTPGLRSRHLNHSATDLFSGAYVEWPFSIRINRERILLKSSGLVTPTTIRLRVYFYIFKYFISTLLHICCARICPRFGSDISYSMKYFEAKVVTEFHVLWFVSSQNLTLHAQILEICQYIHVRTVTFKCCYNLLFRSFGVNISLLRIEYVLYRS